MGEVPRNQVVQGDCLEEMQNLPDESVDCIITSPPYWGLRVYEGAPDSVYGGNTDCSHEWVEGVLTEGGGGSHLENSTYDGEVGRGPRPGDTSFQYCRSCGAWKGQLGQEPTPQMFVEHLVEIFVEAKRVLKPSGNLFVNLGDTYSGYRGAKWNKKQGFERDELEKDEKYPDNSPTTVEGLPGKIGIPNKSLCLVPERFAVKMVDEGWILRNRVTWAKSFWRPEDGSSEGAGMPFAGKDRLNDVHEPVFHFVKQQRYWYDLAAVSIPHKTGSENGDRGSGKRFDLDGKNPGDVMCLGTAQYPDTHYAVFPEALPEVFIRAGCPEKVCSECGTPWSRGEEEEVDEDPGYLKGSSFSEGKTGEHQKGRASEKERRKKRVSRELEPACSCGGEVERGVVLDPFTGAGTTLVTAHNLRRDWLGIELSPEYVEMARNRVEKECSKRLTDYIK